MIPPSWSAARAIILHTRERLLYFRRNKFVGEVVFVAMRRSDFIAVIVVFEPHKRDHRQAHQKEEERVDTACLLSGLVL
jgi:hypothetical protein